jgi:acyl-CoA thioesterase FadM
VLHQEIHDQEGRCVCDAKVTSVVMDMSTRKTVSLPESLSGQFDPDHNQETS